MTLNFMIINRLIHVEIATWIQQKIISGQRTDKNFCQFIVNSEITSCPCDATHCISKTSGRCLKTICFVAAFVYPCWTIISAFLKSAQLSERCISARPYDLNHDHSVHVFFGKLMEGVDPSSVLLIRRADVGCALSALFTAQVLAASLRGESISRGLCYSPQLLYADAYRSLDWCLRVRESPALSWHQGRKEERRKAAWAVLM